MTAPRGPRGADGGGSDESEPDEEEERPLHRRFEAPGQGDDEWPASLLVATGWTAGATLVFLSLLSVIVAARPDVEPDLISAFACQTIAYLLGLFAILRVHAPSASIRELLGVRPTHPVFYPLALLTGLACEAPVSALYDAIERRWPSPGSGDGDLVRLIAESSTAMRVALCLIIVGLGPALEEVFFRGALARLLRRGAGPALAILGTGMLFAVAHVQPQKFLPIGLFGVALGVLRYASGSLLPGIIMHATFNAIPLVAVLGAGLGSEGAQGAPGVDGMPLPPWLVAASSALAAGLLGLTWAVGARAQGAARARERDGAPS